METKSMLYCRRAKNILFVFLLCAFSDLSHPPVFEMGDNPFNLKLIVASKNLYMNYHATLSECCIERSVFIFCTF